MNDKARLHEKAVQAVARGDVDPPKRQRRKVERRPAKTFKNVKVDERVMEEVKRRNPGGKYAIRIEGPTSVVITNRMRNIG